MKLIISVDLDNPALQEQDGSPDWLIVSNVLQHQVINIASIDEVMPSIEIGMTDGKGNRVGSWKVTEFDD